MDASHTCLWCSAQIPAGATACPKCGAIVEGAAAVDIPGVTVPDPNARISDDEGLLPHALDPKSWFDAGKDREAVSEEAIAPPSDAVRREIERMKLEAQIDNAGLEVMNPMGDETIDVGKPSDEAIAAYDAGLLDKSPAEEAELDERAKGLEMEQGQ